VRWQTVLQTSRTAVDDESVGGNGVSGWLCSWCSLLARCSPWCTCLRWWKRRLWSPRASPAGLVGCCRSGACSADSSLRGAQRVDGWSSLVSRAGRCSRFCSTRSRHDASTRANYVSLYKLEITTGRCEGAVLWAVELTRNEFTKMATVWRSMGAPLCLPSAELTRSVRRATR
jgi:hypothetical protein